MRKALAFLAFFASTIGAQACMCIALAPSSVRAQADTILYGRVLAVQEGARTRARLKVLHVVKGKPAGVIRIEAPGGGDSCAVPLKPGMAGEFVLSRRGGRYATNYCLMQAAGRG